MNKKEKKILEKINKLEDKLRYQTYRLILCEYRYIQDIESMQASREAIGEALFQFKKLFVEKPREIPWYLKALHVDGNEPVGFDFYKGFFKLGSVKEGGDPYRHEIKTDEKKESPRNIIEEFMKARQAIFDHVGFEENWTLYPITDETEMFWNVNRGQIRYAETMEKLEDKDNKMQYYEDDIFGDRFYDKMIYEGEDFSMLFCNPHVDGMQWLRIFDNKKRVEEKNAGREI